MAIICALVGLVAMGATQKQVVGTKQTNANQLVSPGYVRLNHPEVLIGAAKSSGNALRRLVGPQLLATMRTGGKKFGGNNFGAILAPVGGAPDVAPASADLGLVFALNPGHFSLTVTPVRDGVLTAGIVGDQHFSVAALSVIRGVYETRAVAMVKGSSNAKPRLVTQPGKHFTWGVPLAVFMPPEVVVTKAPFAVNVKAGADVVVEVAYTGTYVRGDFQRNTRQGTYGATLELSQNGAATKVPLKVTYNGPPLGVSGNFQTPNPRCVIDRDFGADGFTTRANFSLTNHDLVTHYFEYSQFVSGGFIDVALVPVDDNDNDIPGRFDWLTKYPIGPHQTIKFRLYYTVHGRQMPIGVVEDDIALDFKIDDKVKRFTLPLQIVQAARLWTIASAPGDPAQYVGSMMIWPDGEYWLSATMRGIGDIALTFHSAVGPDVSVVAWQHNPDDHRTFAVAQDGDAQSVRADYQTNFNQVASTGVLKATIYKYP